MIRTREDVLKEIAYSIRGMPRIQRALLEDGQVEFFGGFKQIPPWNSPGWIVKLTSRFKMTWYIAIIVKQKGHIIMTRFIDDLKEGKCK